jgi:mRNA-degrading endonuclease RelE of RelBE toxin-antitoxin system
MIVEFDKSFEKSLEKIKNKSIYEKIEHIINSFEVAESVDKIHHIKKLSAFKNYYRIRMGYYRIGLETVWLTQEQMSVLFGKARSTINEHIKNIYEEKELEETQTTKKFGNSEFQQKAHHYYNLDVNILVGYCVKSLRGTQFRQ